MTLPIIFSAIHLMHPGIPNAIVNSYARVIERQAEVAGVDPMTFVTIIEHESQWNPNTISKDGEDYGLMQVRGRFYGGKVEWLFNPTTNIAAGGYIIKKSKEFCRKHLQREPEYQEWMACYQGSCTPKNMCKPTKLTQVFEDYETCIKKDVEEQVEHSSCRDIFKRYN